MNSDHRDNIGTHPAYSQDPETRLRARLEAAQRRRVQAEQDYTTARNNLRVFLEHQEREQTLGDAMARHVAAHRAQVARAREIGVVHDECTLEAKA